ncbi:hypothetical protein OVY48_00940 [Sphingobium sp. SA2]|uniref:DUF5661 family protein n=1 Tax=Sphingobium sp. SA2 TaxID=1524832 RepID=UPI0028C37176|nr:DUF5661 family protein [Sphingobium sp. SA2]MDT7532021.1 hypothetical protein [Sphingobium sp. SA2]
MADHDFTREEALAIGNRLSIDWTRYDVEEFRLGLGVELEHGTENPSTNVTDDDLDATAKIAIAHLNDLPDYYTRLYRMFAKAGYEVAGR